LAGQDLQELIAAKDKTFVTNTMYEGAQQKALDLQPGLNDDICSKKGEN
jgi:hypothetical protein